MRSLGLKFTFVAAAAWAGTAWGSTQSVEVGSAETSTTCENALSNPLHVMVDVPAWERAGFTRVGETRFWARGAFVFEDLGTGRARVWQSFFREWAPDRFSTHLTTLRMPNDQQFHLLASLITSPTPWAETEPDSLEKQLERARLSADGEPGVWTQLSNEPGHNRAVFVLQNERGEVRALFPATLPPGRGNFDVDLLPAEQGTAKWPQGLELGNGRLKFRLLESGDIIDVTYSANLSEVPVQDPIFARARAGTKDVDPLTRERADRDRGFVRLLMNENLLHTDLDRLAEPFAKMALLHARQLLAREVDFGDVKVSVEFEDSSDLEASRFDDFTVNAGRMRLVNLRSGRVLTISYLKAYEAFAYGFLGPDEDADRVDPEDLVAFWKE